MNGIFSLLYSNSNDINVLLANYLQKVVSFVYHYPTFYLFWMHFVVMFHKIFWYNESLLFRFCFHPSFDFRKVITNFVVINLECSIFCIWETKLNLKGFLYDTIVIGLTVLILCFSLQEMESYIRGLIPNLAQLRDMPAAFVQMYCRIAAHKFFFFCDPHRRGLHGLYLLVAKGCWVFCDHILLNIDIPYRKKKKKEYQEV